MFVHSVFEDEIDTEVFVLISKRAANSGSESKRFYLMFPGEPVDHVDVMHVLFNYMITASLGPFGSEVEHIFHLRPFGIRIFDVPAFAGIPIAIGTDDPTIVLVATCCQVAA